MTTNQEKLAKRREAEKNASDYFTERCDGAREGYVDGVGQVIRFLGNFGESIYNLKKAGAELISARDFAKLAYGIRDEWHLYNSIDSLDEPISYNNNIAVRDSVLYFPDGRRLFFNNSPVLTDIVSLYSSTARNLPFHNHIRNGFKVDAEIVDLALKTIKKEKDKSPEDKSVLPITQKKLEIQEGKFIFEGIPINGKQGEEFLRFLFKDFYLGVSKCLEGKKRIVFEDFHETNEGDYFMMPLMLARNSGGRYDYSVEDSHNNHLAEERYYYGVLK